MNYRYKISHFKDKDNCVSDTWCGPNKAETLVLSQSSLDEGYIDLNFIDDNVGIILIDEIKDATDEDRILSLKLNFVTHGWLKTVGDEFKALKQKENKITVEWFACRSHRNIKNESPGPFVYLVG